MTYDFTTLVKRNNASLIDTLMLPGILTAGNIPFSGAEPLYATAPAIREAVIRMAQNGRYGYTLMDTAYQTAVVSWMENARGFNTEPEWIVPTLGTIHSVAVAIRLFCAENESIIVTTPVYYRYEQAATRLNRNTIKCPLKMENGRYNMDFTAIDAAMARPDTKLFILCNPHNPIGQIWTPDELEQLALLAEKHDICVFSDEIFAENSLGDRRCPSYLTIPHTEKHSIVATSLGKAFGTTGFNHANMLIPDQTLRETFADRRSREHYGSMDPVVYEILLAAYTPEGLDWISASNAVIETNIQTVKTFFARNLPDVPVHGGEGGYIAWIDWRSRFPTEQDLMDFLHYKAYLLLDPGSQYDADRFTRMSLACPRHCVEQALQTLGTALKNH